MLLPLHCWCPSLDIPSCASAAAPATDWCCGRVVILQVSTTYYVLLLSVSMVAITHIMRVGDAFNAAVPSPLHHRQHPVVCCPSASDPQYSPLHHRSWRLSLSVVLCVCLSHEFFPAPAQFPEPQPGEPTSIEWSVYGGSSGTKFSSTNTFTATSALLMKFSWWRIDWLIRFSQPTNQLHYRTTLGGTRDNQSLIQINSCALLCLDVGKHPEIRTSQRRIRFESKVTQSLLKVRFFFLPPPFPSMEFVNDAVALKALVDSDEDVK